MVKREYACGGFGWKTCRKADAWLTLAQKGRRGSRFTQNVHTHLSGHNAFTSQQTVAFKVTATRTSHLTQQKTSFNSHKCNHFSKNRFLYPQLPNTNVNEVYKIASSVFLNCSTLTNQSFIQSVNQMVRSVRNLALYVGIFETFTFLIGDIIFETIILQKSHLKGKGKDQPRTGHEGPKEE